MQRVRQVNYKGSILAIYIGTVMIMLGMIFCNMLLKDKKTAFYGLGDYIDITDEWLDSTGFPFLFEALDTYTEEPMIKASYTISNVVDEGESIIFRSKNVSVVVTLEGDIVYQTEVVEAPFYNHSPGTRWNIVPIHTSDENKTMEIFISVAYEDGRSKIDNIYYGDGSAIIIDIIKNKGLGLFISVLMLFIGIIYMIANLIINWNISPKDHSIMYLGIFAIICSIWCLLETNVFQLFSNNLRLIQTMDNMMLVIGGIPLYLYMDSSYSIFKNKVLRIICLADVVYIVLATFSHLTGLWDYHQTLNGAVITYGIISIILGDVIVRKVLDEQSLARHKSRNLEIRCQQIGISILGIAVFGEFMRYLFIDVMDRAFIIRIGLLLCIICLGTGNIYRMIQLVKQGAQAEIISKLAYQDGLTEIGNRTAYIERVNRLIQKPTGNKLGIIALDINNLKMTNDHLGHSFGDELIKIVAHIIEGTFGQYSDVYRTGGDEFIALIEHKNPASIYLKMLEPFKQLISDYNEEATYPFEISIAHGVAYCYPVTRSSFEVAAQEADKEMYKNKCDIKTKQLYSMRDSFMD